MTIRKLALLLTATALAGCPGRIDNESDAADGSVSDVRDVDAFDGGRDAAPDAQATESGTDTGMPDGATDTGSDAAIDTGSDAGSDVANDTGGEDAGTDAVVADDVADEAVATDAASDAVDESVVDDAGTDVVIAVDAGTDVVAVDVGTDVPPIEMCPAGSDGTTCATGHCCGMACVSNNSIATCGASCTPCATPANATATCDGTACGFVCNVGFHDCGGPCVSDTAVATCGASCTACVAPANGVATCDGTGCGFTCDAGYIVSGAACIAGPVTEPRPLAPVSTGILASLTVDFRWALATGSTGARLDICSDRACTTVVQTQDVTGTSASVTLTAPTAGASRVRYWRLYGLNATVAGTTSSPVWSFTIRGRGTAVHSSWGTVPDFNGDGFADAIVGAPAANLVRVYNGRAMTAPVSATASTAIAGDASSEFGNSVAGAGDVNGDGYADLIVGAPGADAAYLFYGSAAGFAATLASATADATLPGTAGTRFGASVAGAGDVNGDGYADVIVGSPGEAAAYVYYGSATGTASTAFLTLSDIAGSRFGASVATAGDANGDGYDDVVVGAPGAVRAAVYLGSATGLATTPATSLTGNAGSDFGSAVATGGDVNGDGYTDLLVSAPLESVVYVFNGSSAGVPTAFNGALRKVINTTSGPVGFGTAVASAGDGNNDGYADVIIGAPGASMTGGLDLAYVFHGGAAGLANTAAGSSTAHQRSFSTTYTSQLGTAVGGTMDLNGDGYDDLLVGAPGANTTYLYAGGASGFPTAITVTLTGGTGVTTFGTSVAAAPTHRMRRGLRLAFRD